jgi:hypothetical protein
VIVDQYGNTVSESRPEFCLDNVDPLAAAVWSRALSAAVSRPGLFDGPAVVDPHGSPVTAPARGARLDVFFGSALDGAICITDKDEG